MAETEFVNVFGSFVPPSVRMMFLKRSHVTKSCRCPLEVLVKLVLDVRQELLIELPGLTAADVSYLRLVSENYHQLRSLIHCQLAQSQQIRISCAPRRRSSKEYL